MAFVLQGYVVLAVSCVRSVPQIKRMNKNNRWASWSYTAEPCALYVQTFCALPCAILQRPDVFDTIWGAFDDCKSSACHTISTSTNDEFAVGHVIEAVHFMTVNALSFLLHC